MLKNTSWIFIVILLTGWACSNKNTDHEDITKTSLKIMTYNIHHANPPSKSGVIDIDAIAKVIKKENPDLVALQEVDVFTNRSGKDLHEAREIANKLGMQYYFAKALDYQGGYYGNTVLSKFPIEDSILIELPALSDVNAEDRAWGGIKVQLDGKLFWFGSTHLDFKTEENNLHQTNTLLKALEEISIPVIIGGDFNVIGSSKTIGLFDKEFQRTCTEDCPYTIPMINPTKTIDFLMFRPKNTFSTTSHHVVDEEYASDHRPVVAEVTVDN